MDVHTAPLRVDRDSASRTEGDSPGWMLGGRYLVSSRIGSGGMAEVFRATDVLLGRDVAVKVFRSIGPTDDTGGAERQEAELRALARLNHPHLITLYDASITEQPPYLVMELVDGPNLAARIAGGPMPESEVRVVGSQMADALSYVHAHGMVHRDVKPANILLGEDCFSSDSCRARLSDFGIVRLLGSERMTAADFTLGTASYLAPEQARGGDVSPAADVYSLGLVLIEALTGKRSFDGPPVEAVLARLARDPEIPADLPEPWLSLLPAMTARDPQARPAPADVSRALRSGSSSVATGVLPATAAVAAPAGPASAGPASAGPASAGPASAGPASATAVTTAVPAAAVWAEPIPSAWPMRPDSSRLSVESVGPDTDDKRRGGWWFALAAVFLLMIIGVASWFALGSSPDSGTETPAGGGAPTTSSAHRPAPKHANTVNAVVPKPGASHPATTAAAKKSSAPAATRSAPSTSSVPSVSSSAPPETSAPGQTSAPATTNAPPPSSEAVAIAPPAVQPSPSG